MYQGEGWLILSVILDEFSALASVSRGGVVDSQRGALSWVTTSKCIKGRGG